MHTYNGDSNGIYARIVKITMRESNLILYVGYAPLLLGYFGRIVQEALNFWPVIEDWSWKCNMKPHSKLLSAFAILV